MLSSFIELDELDCISILTVILAWDDFFLSTYEEDILSRKRKGKNRNKRHTIIKLKSILIRSHGSKQTQPTSNPTKKGDKNAKKKTSAKKSEYKDGVKWKKLILRT